MAARTLENLRSRYSRSVASKGRGGMHGPRPPRGGKGKPKNMKGTVKRLLSYISEQKMLLVVVFIFMIIKTGASLAGSYMLRPIINTFLSPDSDLFGKLSLFAAALLVLLSIHNPYSRKISYICTGIKVA